MFEGLINKVFKICKELIDSLFFVDGLPDDGQVVLVFALCGEDFTLVRRKEFIPSLQVELFCDVNEIGNEVFGFWFFEE